MNYRPSLLACNADCQHPQTKLTTSIPSPPNFITQMDVDPDSVHAQHGNRNKRAKTTPKFETKKPLTLREKKEQEELNRIKAEARAEAKAKRRMQALHSKRSN